MVDASLADSPAEQDPRESAFFTANMEAFREYAPHLHVRLQQVQETHSRLVVDVDGSVDIALGDRRFYGHDAVEFTQLQIDEYFERPERRYIDSLNFGEDDGLEQRFKDILTAAVEAESVSLAERRVDTTGHFTVVFGLGLGLHLDPLSEFTGCAELIIVEPNFENLYHSLSVIDWGALFEKAAQNGCSIHLVFEKDQEEIAAQLRKVIRLSNPALIDGVYVFQHYGSSLLTEARKAFIRDLSLHVVGLGFFEDEMLMMANAVTNLKQKNTSVLTLQHQPRTEPVFICGSGPSIDGDLEVIAAQRDRAIVVSLGSGIRTLLAHGIRPDMHVETENHTNNSDNIERVAQEFGLNGIALLGAVTVQPVMVEKFDKSFFYFRDGQVPSAVFVSESATMGSAGPTVANAALVTLTHMGFREIYLFGIDMGSRHLSHYHSASTYIGLGEAEEWANVQRLPAPANFGGEVVADGILAWSRASLENVLHQNPNIHCVNFSDGARIDGTIPMLPSVLDLQNPPIDFAQSMDEIRDELRVFPLDLMARIYRDAEMAKRSQELFAGIDAIFAAAEELDDSSLVWVDELFDILNETRAKSPEIGIYLLGTTLLFLGSFNWFDGRIEDAQFRRRFRRTAVLELRSLYAQMEQRLLILLADVGRCIDGEIDVVNAAFDM